MGCALEFPPGPHGEDFLKCEKVGWKEILTKMLFYELLLVTVFECSLGFLAVSNNSPKLSGVPRGSQEFARALRGSQGFRWAPIGAPRASLENPRVPRRLWGTPRSPREPRRPCGNPSGRTLHSLSLIHI